MGCELLLKLVLRLYWFFVFKLARGVLMLNPYSLYIRLDYIFLVFLSLYGVCCLVLYFLGLHLQKIIVVVSFPKSI